MQRISPKIVAKLVYEMLKDKKEEEAKDVIKNIAAFMAKKNLIKQEAEIIKCFSEYFDLKNNIAEVEIVAAQKLDDETRSAITNFISEMTKNKTIKEKIKLDETKLGGFSVKIGDKIHDFTIRKNINNLKNTLNK